MTTSPLPGRVQLDRLFYNVIGIKPGGMGEVWLLERPQGAPVSTIYEKRLAVKTFNVDDEEKVVRELMIWAMLNHRSVVPLIRIARLNFRLAAMMPMMLYGLDHLLERHRRLPAAEVVTVLVSVSEALDFAYSAFRVVHLDLKPANVLVGSVTPLTVKVADWGISRIDPEPMQAASGGLGAPTGRHQLTMYGGGTPPYMAPERFEPLRERSWAKSPAVDIYSLGMIAVELLTGTLPFDLDRDLGRQIVSGDYFRNAKSLLRKQPRDLAALCLRCLDPEPSRRPGAFEPLLGALRACQV